MDIAKKRILITGAGGGIGRHLALALAKKGGTLLLADRDTALLEGLCKEIAAVGGRAAMSAADLMQEGAAGRLAAAAIAGLGEVDILVNLAGILSFNPFQNESDEGIERLWRVNVIAPMQLTRALLPHMLARGNGRVVNIGSTFGSIGFPFFANYSACKFAVRGFSQALRRELEGTGVGVTYVAPRYTKTSINAGVVSRMSEAMKMNMDEPERVAANIVRAIEKDAKEFYIGFPECLFTRINAILPGLVDGSLRKQVPEMRKYAEQQSN